MSDPAELREWLSLAEEAADAAVRTLAGGGGDGRLVERRDGRETKVVADGRAENAILTRLQKGSSVPILTEEAGDLGGAMSSVGYRWIVDPLDGSLNYSRELPMFAVSIALWDGDAPLIGVVRDPERRETFTGIIGVGAWLNGEAITPSAIARTSEAVLCTGFPTSTDFSPEALGRFVRRIRRFDKLRLLGSAALSLAYVASGRADAYQENDIKLWDIAAGAALVRAAGGALSIQPGSNEMTRCVAATNGRLVCSAGAPLDERAVEPPDTATSSR